MSPVWSGCVSSSRRTKASTIGIASGGPITTIDEGIEALPGVAVGQTGDNGTEPYSGALNPSQKLQLTIQCTTGKVTGVKLHTDKIKCSHSQKDKGTKIYNCHNKSDKSHHSWQLKSYQCPQDPD